MEGEYRRVSVRVKEYEKAQSAITCLEHGERGHKPRNVGGLWKLEKSMNSPIRPEDRNIALLILQLNLLKFSLYFCPSEW